MHGREQREGENHRRIVIPSRGCSQHMRSVPSNSTRTSIADADSSLISTTITTFASADYFCKDGRKISVGDCALFKPAQDSPPFIGLIRRLILSKENHLVLGLNWLYRPAEVTLGKGILLDAAPNELFYSFHKDEVAAAALLHPCKVAFLPKGAELPTGISSFVCQRVYDIKNKCLWWLTDQDYINERQEEIDQLLNKTRVEMDATLQSGGRSPKPTSNLISTSQLKPGSDGLQNSVTSIPSQTKGKKRERGDQSSSDPVKRERSLKTDDSDSNIVKTENSLKSEIAKITEKGGLADSESVEKLVQLIQPDRMDKKMDLMSRSMLAGVIAATDRFDCLNRFVQLKGLPVLDEWLQDVNKGRIGDGSGSKDGDKSSEDFLLVLLRALDKLPVNLHALQTSNIGRSVNHLRTHKNLEIQRKARSLVDTWKKRVEAEMNVIDAKSGSTQAASWPSKTRLPDGHGGRSSGGSGDVVLKSSVTQVSASKTASVKVSNVETTTKSASLSPGPIKSASSPASGKEVQPRTTTGCVTDVPLSVREDKSSSSSQSHNYSQSFSGKEDARSSTAVSMSVNKISSGGSRHRKSINGYPGASVSGSPKEAGRNSSMHRNVAQEKFSQSASTGEKVFDVPVEGGGHKLIVKLNRGRSPAQSMSGGSFEDPSIMSSRASSPVLSDRHEQSDRNSKEKCDAYRANIPSDVNAESWQSNDFKDLQTGSDEGDGSPATLPEEERSKNVEDRKPTEVSKAASSSSGNDLKSGKLHEASFSSMNALIESCAKYSEANASMSPADEVGMNLLASVAAGEMCKSQLVSPTDSPQGSAPAIEETCMGDDAKSKPPPGDNLARDQCLASDAVDVVDEKQAGPSISSWSKDGLHHAGNSPTEVTVDRKPDSILSTETREATVDRNSEMNEKSEEFKGSSIVKLSMERDGGQTNQPHEEKTVGNSTREDACADSKLGEGSLLSEVKVGSVGSHTEEVKQKVEVSSSNPSAENECRKDVNDRLTTGVQIEHKPALLADQTNVSGKDLAAEAADEVKAGEATENRGSNGPIPPEGQKSDKESNHTIANEDQNPGASGLSHTEQRNDYAKASAQNKEVFDTRSSGSFPQTESLGFRSRDTDGDVELKGSKISDVEADKRVEYKPSMADDTSLFVADTAEMDSKVNFDLNEGLGDDGKYGEPMNSVSAGSLSNIHLVNPLASAISSGSSSIPASITVAAAAKGAFVPPVDLMRTRGELGWKGSAATSAFRPAEPRKVLQLPVGPINPSVTDDSSSKQCRPLLDIDLNVPDERLLEDMGCRESTTEIGSSSDHLSSHGKPKNELSGSAPCRSSGGLDLDLNRVDDSNDMMQYPVSSTRRLEANIIPVKSLSSTSLPSNEVRRDFDLNGPGVDDATAEQSSFNHQGRGSTLSVHTQLPVASIRPSSLESGNFSAWFPSGNSYSSVSIPSVLPDRGEQQPFPIIAPGAPQRILGPPGGNPFTPDIYRGSVLSSSPAVPFASGPFQYQMFPFGGTLPPATFSVGSTSYMDSTPGGRLFNPPVNSQFLGPVGAVSSQYPRPYMVSLPDGSNNGSVENNRKWSRQGLDLNAGPGGLDAETREETLAQRQLSVASSQALAEEQARMYSVGGGVLKRKEPDGGWENESFRYKQSSWQ